MRSVVHTSAAMIKAAFTEEIAVQQGSVIDTFEDGERLFLRSLLPQRVDEVRPKDQVQGGVALRSNGNDVFLHPYVFRVVCTNGAIMAQATQTRHLADLPLLAPEEALPMLREAVEACCEPEAFTTAVRDMRSAAARAVDFGLTVLPLLSRLPAASRMQVMQEVLGRWSAAGDTSAFGLMNAVTALARDTRDPELRWDLEELGGAIAALRPATVSPGSAGRIVERQREEVLVG